MLYYASFAQVTNLSVPNFPFKTASISPDTQMNKMKVCELEAFILNPDLSHTITASVLKLFLV